MTKAEIVTRIYEQTGIEKTAVLAHASSLLEKATICLAIDTC